MATTKTFVNPTEMLTEKLAKYKELKAQEKELQDKISKLNNELKTVMTTLNINAMQCGELTAEVVECTRTGVDKDNLEKDFPEIYEQYKTETPYTKLIVK